MNRMNKLASFALSQIKRSNYARTIYTVHHNEKRGLFYVKLEDNSRAVLHYIAEGRVLDMQRINVPYQYSGKGLARLLAEVQVFATYKQPVSLEVHAIILSICFQTAFTYAIVNYYYMYLSCDYMQRYYLAVKNSDLEEVVVGPPHLLEGPDSESLDPISPHELPDPDEFNI
ncbi:uncharacterized protein LOC108631583 isoform X1 [Ceratina calcarata]|uniref:Uncharacterized protein LOC108631583 isoform X1 n=1 Tax=Ceratina calcarata TaxID=156304 RepID=A0AAJ7SCU9_9HYME|nr:uncharacterized protein LOC108631583 isoform X1 [Ceratina calcarata]